MHEAADNSTHRDDVTVIWCLSDGRTGHRRQVEGLVSQLAGRRPVQAHWIDVTHVSYWQAIADGLQRRFRLGERLPSPNLLLGAGHRTHLPLLMARRARGGRTVVLMRPSLPTGLFDLCLVPDHDLLSPAGRLVNQQVVATRGVLNPFQPSTFSDPGQGLILIGGPSRHHKWSDDDVLQQCTDVRRLSSPAINWTLSTSRRTPTSFLTRARAMLSDAQQNSPIQIVPFERTDSNWLKQQLSRSATVFVSEDSISMVYEALTVGARVGLLQVPRRGRSRNNVCIDRLQDEQLVVGFERWRVDQFESCQRVPFNEASRCAEVVCDQLLDAA